MENEILEQKILEYIMFRGGNIQNTSLADNNQIANMNMTYPDTNQFLYKLAIVFENLTVNCELVIDAANKESPPDFITVYFLHKL
tara:strand:+ start:270 stop:524 length:255 start_codon:yes stop_codon:yes gene_type:complete